MRVQPGARDCKMYLSNGLYTTKLRAWWHRYKSRLLVLRLEGVIADIEGTTAQLASFLGVRKQTPPESKLQQIASKVHWHGPHKNSASKSKESSTESKMSPFTTTLLQAFYLEDQRQLAALGLSFASKNPQ